MNTAIHLDNISKIYKRYSHGIDRLREIITHHPCHQAFTALHPMNLTILKGQVIGIVGKNGAGKSTLLKLVAGTLHPDQGHCHVMGRVAALLELGGGFHPEMSGRENVYLNGAMMGWTLKTSMTCMMRLSRLLKLANLWNNLSKLILQACLCV